MDLFSADLVPAEFSECRTWRYVLRRQWGEGDMLGFILLNPSTADETQDDPTIRRCVGYAKAWGYAGLVLGNLFAFRATDPKDMKAASDPIGPDNDKALGKIVHETHGQIVCGWGGHGGFLGRSAVVRDFLMQAAAPVALSLTASGEPGHPLYLKADAAPFRLVAANG